MNPLASVNDVITLFRTLTPEEASRTNALLPLLSDYLRQEAIKVNKDIDTMITTDKTGTYQNTVKLVIVDIVARILRQNMESEPLSQESQSALGYTWSGTYAVPGGGFAAAVMKNDLKRLGLKRQQIGVIDLA